MAIRPPPAAAPSAAGAPFSPDNPELALWTRLQAAPAMPIQVLSGAASRVILSRPCVLVGFTFRETTGVAAAQLELFNGSDATGEIVAEMTIPAPLPGSVGNADVDIDATANVAAAANTATLAAAVGATTFITGFEISGLGATAAATVTVTVTGVLGGSKTYSIAIPAGVTVGFTPLVVEFGRPIPASGLNTAIAVVCTSPGAGNTAFNVTAHGFQRTVGSTAAQTGQAPSQNLPGAGLLCRSGLFMRIIVGSVVGAVWVKW